MKYYGHRALVEITGSCIKKVYVLPETSYKVEKAFFIAEL